MAEKTSLVIDVRDRASKPFAVDRVTVTSPGGTKTLTTPPFVFDLVVAGGASLKLEKARHHTYDFALDVRASGDKLTVDFGTSMIDAPRMASLTKASASASSGGTVAKNVLSIVIGEPREVFLVSGYDSRPHDPNAPPASGAKYRAWVTQRMHDLAARGRIDDSTVITFLEAETGELTRWVRGRGQERLSADFKWRSGWSRLSLDAGAVPNLDKKAAGYPGAGVRGMPFIYRRIEEIGRLREHTLEELSIFSHSGVQGPILFNYFQTDDYTKDGRFANVRDPFDTDGRFYKDFNRTNMPNQALFVAAFSASPLVKIWGCLAVREYADAIQAAIHATSDTQTLGTSLEARKLWFRQATIYPDTRPGIIQSLRENLRTGNFVFVLAKVINSPAYGSAPGLGTLHLKTAFGEAFYVPEFFLSIVDGKVVKGAAQYKSRLDFLKANLGWTFDEGGYLRYDP
jgi:hypothetical protein